MEETGKKRDFVLPASILIAAVLISGAVVYNAGKKNGGTVDELSARLAPEETGNSAANVAPIRKDDHVFGNPNAPVKVIEFSDLECPFCKRFHGVMQQVVADSKGEIAWVYRHFPLDALHSKARKEAEATECAAELGGALGSEASNKAFWKYVDGIFAVTPSNNGLALDLLPKIAEDGGLNRNAFEACLASGKYAEKVAKDLEDATNAGGRGTPYSIVLGKNGKIVTIPGALPYEQTMAIINQVK